MSSPSLTPLSVLHVSHHQVPSYNYLPNTSISHHPLLIYHSVFQPPISPSSVEAHLSRTGVVRPQWRYTMYPTTHYHSNTHEVLAVCSGRAKLCFGGDDNPTRVQPVVQRGDVIIVPAGLGHRLLKDLGDGDFEMVGSYPVGSPAWDMCYGRPEEINKIEHIKDVGWFARDPIYGDEGPVLRYATTDRPSSPLR